MSKTFFVLALLAITFPAKATMTLAQIKQELLKGAFSPQPKPNRSRSEVADHIPHRNLNLAEDVRDIMNFLPSSIGVAYNDVADKDVSAIGNSVLAYGMYNNKAREESLRKLKEKFKKGMFARNLYIKSLNRRNNMFKSVSGALQSQMKLLDSRSIVIIDELKETAKNKVF